MRDQIREEDIDTILAHLPTLATLQTTEDQDPDPNQDPQAPVRFIDIHVYDLASNEEEPFIIESTLQSQEPTHNSEQTPPGEYATTPSQRVTRWYVIAALVLVCCVLMTGAATLLFLVPTWTPSATVTIVPVSKQITTTSTITIVPGAVTDPAHHQLAGRVFASVTMSQARTIATTGTSHQDAKAAQGQITFYNAAPVVQTITVGTLLTGADGIQVVTDQDATIPAVNYPTLGQMTVTAHAVIAGPEGNSKAGDIYGPCCRVNVSAVSSAFTGGQDARTSQTVTQQDINTITATLKASIDHSVQAAFQAQVHPDETLITPFPCQQSSIADHQPGDEAVQVSLTESETCTGEAYSTSASHGLMIQIVSQEATKQLGAGYISAGDIQTSITQTTLKDQNAVTVQITGAGTWAYQFDPTRQQSMMNMIAGKNKMQALALLLHVSGVQSASVTVTRGVIIPTESASIHIVYLLPA